jgi:hypothetical protein
MISQYKTNADAGALNPWRIGEEITKCHSIRDFVERVGVAVRVSDALTEIRYSIIHAFTSKAWRF